MSCIFCQIAEHTIPSNTVYEDDRFIIFRDIAPMAPTHLVAIPKKHIESFNALEQEDFDLLADLLKVIQQVVKEEGLFENGYRLVNNCGRDGGQTVPHLHFHILGGKTLDVKLA